MCRGGIKCRRVMDHVYSDFSFGREMDRIKRWETKIMMRLFRFKREKDETRVEFHTRGCNDTRKIWIQIRLPFLCEIIAEGMWRATGWACDQRPDAVIASLKQGFQVEKFSLVACFTY